MNQSKKLAKTLCLIATATSVATQYPTCTPVYAFAESTMNSIVKTAVNTEDIQEIDISKATVWNGMINIVLNQNGKYRITGSNLINDARVNTQISVPEGVTVDLYFDGASIHNPYLRQEEKGCGPAINQPVSPLVVDGTANIYVEKNTTIAGANNLLTVNGTLNIMGSENNALLTVQTEYCSQEDNDLRMANQSGTINMIDGNVLFNNESYGDKSESYNTKFHIMGGTIKFKSIKTEIGFHNNVIIDGGLIEGIDFSNRGAKNSNGDSVVKQSFAGITSNSKIVQVGKYKQNSFVTDAEGNMKDIYVPQGKDVVLYTEDKAYLYKYENGKYSDTPEVKNAYKVTLMLDDKEFDSYRVKENDTLKLPTDVEYNYTFTANDKPFTEETIITADTVITMKKSTKKYYKVTIDDASYQMEYGTLLKDCSGYKEGTIYEDASDNIYFENFIITSDIKLMKLDMKYVMKDNTRFITIASLTQLEKFAALVNAGHNNLNGLLTADIQGDFTTPIGTYQKRYIGTFDGQGHSVQLNIDSTEMCKGMFGAVSGGATVKNVVTKGTVNGGMATGGIIGGSRGKGTVTITGCINSATVTSSGTYAGGIIGRNLESESTYIITNCGNLGNISGTSYSGGICGWSGNNASIKNCYNAGKIGKNSDKKYFAGGDSTKIENCYQINNKEQEQENVTSVSEEAFHSGEVTYKLNGDQSNIIWLQTCGRDYPIINGNRETQTVFYGYKDGTATENTYFNIEPIAAPTTKPTTPTTKPTTTPTTKPSSSSSSWDDYSTPTSTVVPTTAPSMTPTVTPSETPSATPTETPSATPTAVPLVTPSATPSETPTDEPSVVPSAAPSKAPTTKPSSTPTPTKAPDKGTTVTDKKGTDYKVVSNGKTPTVAYQQPAKNVKGTVSIPSTTKVNGITYKVTEIAPNTFKDNKKITKIDVGSNVKTIGKNAFSGCSKLEKASLGKSVSSIGSKVFSGCGKLNTIIIKSTKLTSKNVSKTAFKGLKSNAKVEVPKSVYEKYKGFFYDRGLNKKAKIKKSK